MTENNNEAQYLRTALQGRETQINDLKEDIAKLVNFIEEAANNFEAREFFSPHPDDAAWLVSWIDFARKVCQDGPGQLKASQGAIRKG